MNEHEIEEFLIDIDDEVSDDVDLNFLIKDEERSF